jgi:multidrug transporter EmrE-like cation transporter
MPENAVSTMPTRFGPTIWVGLGAVGVLMAGTVLLWAHYGSAVFFEMIAAGIAACF